MSTSASDTASAVPPPSGLVRVLPAVRSLIRAVDAYSRQLSTKLQLTWPQWLCLQALRESPGITGVMLARRVNLGESTLVGVLDRLVAKGLVTRERSVSDRRRQVLRLTNEGEARVDRWQSPLGDSLEQAFNDISAQERDELVRSLASLTRIFSASMPREEWSSEMPNGFHHDDDPPTSAPDE